MNYFVFNVKREKGIYTFLEILTKEEIILNVPARSIHTTFKRMPSLLNTSVNFIYKSKVPASLFDNLFFILCTSNDEKGYYPVATL